MLLLSFLFGAEVTGTAAMSSLWANIILKDEADVAFYTVFGRADFTFKKVKEQAF